MGNNRSSTAHAKSFEIILHSLNEVFYSDGGKNRKD